MTEVTTKIALGRDMIAWLISGLQKLDDVPTDQRDALIKLLYNAQMVSLIVGGVCNDP